jgi:hypothetical protein
LNYLGCTCVDLSVLQAALPVWTEAAIVLTKEVHQGWTLHACTSLLDLLITQTRVTGAWHSLTSLITQY